MTDEYVDNVYVGNVYVDNVYNIKLVDTLRTIFDRFLQIPEVFYSTV